LSLTSFIACYAEGGRFPGKGTSLANPHTKLIVRRRRESVKVLKGGPKRLDFRNVI
jgi:hypothetical protein